MSAVSMCRIVALLVTLAMLLTAPRASAQTAETCVSAFERAQELRRDAKLVEARETLLVCAQPACPRFTTSSCSHWLLEVDEALPSIVVRARDTEGRDVLDVRVSVDGRRLADALDGKSMSLDPGPHKLRFERERYAPTEQAILVSQGEKSRLVTVTFPAPEHPHMPPVVARTRTPALAYALGAVGVVALATGATLDLVALHDRRALLDSCAPFCSSGARTRAETKLAIGDVALGVGAVSLGAALWFFLHPVPENTEPVRAASATGFVVAPHLGLGFVGASGTF